MGTTTTRKGTGSATPTTPQQYRALRAYQRAAVAALRASHAAQQAHSALVAAKVRQGAHGPTNAAYAATRQQVAQRAARQYALAQGQYTRALRGQQQCKAHAVRMGLAPGAVHAQALRLGLASRAA